MLEGVVWALSLKGVSPVARLLAIYMGDQFRWEGDFDDAERSVDLNLAAGWIGCDLEELYAAVDELSVLGLRGPSIDGERLFYRLPRGKPKAAPLRVERQLSIYVIAAGDISKIGISRDVAARLAGLQSANPQTELQLIWSFQGSSKAIRAAERRAHESLEAKRLRNEWFSVSHSEAVAVVKHVLRQAGVEMGHE